MISIDTQWVNRVKNTKTNGFFVFDFTLITIHLSFFLVCWLSLLYSIHLFNIPLLTLNSQFQLYSYLFQFFFVCCCVNYCCHKALLWWNSYHNYGFFLLEIQNSRKKSCPREWKIDKPKRAKNFLVCFISILFYNFYSFWNNNNNKDNNNHSNNDNMDVMNMKSSKKINNNKNATTYSLKKTPNGM